MVEKGTRGGICQAIHRYAKANSKYIKNYDKNSTSSYLTYLVICKQFVSMGNISKTSCKWFRIGRRSISI